MITEILLTANFLVLLAVLLEAKIRSPLGFFIVFGGAIIGIVDLLYVIILLAA